MLTAYVRNAVFVRLEALLRGDVDFRLRVWRVFGLEWLVRRIYVAALRVSTAMDGFATAG